ncbi:phosphotriesterase [Thermodesulfobacteriota bacterium]
MAIINSVLGPLDTVNLGFTLMHEHVLVGSAGVYSTYPELYGPNTKDCIINLLKKAKQGGVDTIVDASTLDLDRHVRLLSEVSRLTEINIIACTGSWLDIPRCYAGVTSDQLAEVFSREIEKGISGTDIKAGILKAASDMEGVKPDEEKVLRAVARSHLRTGVPIMLHSYSPGQVGWQQLDILKDEGVELRHVKMDHCSDTTDLDYLVSLIEAGCYLGMERNPGRVRQVTALARIKTIKALIEKGYAKRICPSMDGNCVPVEKRLTLNPHGFLYIQEVVIPKLREMGVPEPELSRLCIDAPRKFFEGREKS